MAEDRTKPSELDQGKYDADDNVKIICLGDSAVGKSKLMERFLMDGFQPQQLSTYALTLYKHTTTVDDKTILVDFWDTAGQERFQSMHASYYHKAHACIMQTLDWWKKSSPDLLEAELGISIINTFPTPSPQAGSEENQKT
uniref:RAB, member of RAS oncogene family like 2B n=1 Tax=Macaca nemestrina TaxID=9545 RepID=A0A2K6CSG9_MACNE